MTVDRKSSNGETIRMLRGCVELAYEMPLCERKGCVLGTVTDLDSPLPPTDPQLREDITEALATLGGRAWLYYQERKDQASRDTP